MPTGRLLDAYCSICQNPATHVVMDPGSCQCRTCGQVQMLVGTLA